MPNLSTADAIKLGTANVTAAYYGPTQVWPSGFDPLSIGWHSAYWAEDPAWTNPGDGNAVTTWTDASGNGRSITQGTPGHRPLYRASVAALNNKPALDFDGTDDGLASGSAFTATSGDLTKVIVLQWQTAQAGTRHFWSWGNTGGRADLFAYFSGKWATYSPALGVLEGSASDQSPHLIIATFAAAAKIEVDGATVATGSGGGSLSSHSIGRYAAGTEPFDGYIAFAGLYNGTLTAQQKADLLAWSQSHYGTA